MDDLDSPDLYFRDRSANQPWDVFVSYASEDREAVAYPLAIELRKRGFGRFTTNHDPSR
jgi:hypothetical protein